MISTEARHTLRDLRNRGELDGYEAGLPILTCPVCGRRMEPMYYSKESKGILGIGGGLYVRLAYVCTDPWCAQAELTK